MKAIEIDGVVWWKSSYSTAADCVAFKPLDDGKLAVCNSSAPDAGTIIIERNDLADLLMRIKAGAFDDLMEQLS